MVDTASTNGIVHQGERVRQFPLGQTTTMSLTGSISLTWVPSSVATL
jgi:hypothetical protein